MANPNSPYGLRPINNNGTPFTGQLTMYNIPSGDSNNIFIGDPVIPSGASDSYGVNQVTIATAGGSNFTIGPVVSIVNGPAAGATAATTVTRDLPVYRQASVNTYVLVADDPNTLFAIQENSSGGAIAAADVFNNFSLATGSGGSTVTGLSSWQIASNLKNTTTLALRLLRLLRVPGNAIGTNAQWIVRINQHSLWNTVGI